MQRYLLVLEYIGTRYMGSQKQPEKMPAFYYERCRSEGIERTVCDFVSGMTDRYVIELYKELYIPKVWKT